MKLTSTILASVALLGSAAEVPPQTLRQLTNDGHGDSPLEKEDIDPFKSQPIISSVDLAAAADEEFPAVRGLRGTAKLPAMTAARELHPHKNKNRLFRQQKIKRLIYYGKCSSIDLVLSSDDPPECFDAAASAITSSFDIDVNRVDSSSEDFYYPTFYFDCDRQHSSREENRVKRDIDDKCDDTYGTYDSSDFDKSRDVENSDGRKTCGSIDLVPVKSIPTYGSSGDAPVGSSLDDCVEPVAEAVLEYFDFEGINIDTDGTVDGYDQFYIDCGRQRQDRETSKILLQIDSEFRSTCGTYSSGDCETC